MAHFIVVRRDVNEVRHDHVFVWGTRKKLHNNLVCMHFILKIASSTVIQNYHNYTTRLSHLMML